MATARSCRTLLLGALPVDVPSTHEKGEPMRPVGEHFSFFTAKAKPRRRRAVRRHFEKWDREQRRHTKGFLRSSVAAGRDDPNVIRGAVYWANSRNDYASAGRLAQGEWRRELVALLQGPPRWWDGMLGVGSGRDRRMT